MSQGKRLAASLVGLLIGAAFGGAGIYAVFKYGYDRVSQSPQLALLVAVLIGAGLTVLGGYLGLLLAFKAQKRKLVKKRSAKHGPPKFVPRKKRK